MPYPEQLDRAEAGHEPAVRIIAMRIGGKAPPGEQPETYAKKGRGGAKGSIEYEDVTEQHPELVQKYTEQLKARAKQFIAG